MRLLLFATGVMTLAFAGVFLGVLPWVVPEWLWLLASLPVLWSMLAGGWALLAISAGNWFRLRVGHAVAAGGAVGLLLQVVDYRPFALLWALLACTGGLAVAWRRERSPARPLAGRLAKVQPPLTRRG